MIWLEFPVPGGSKLDFLRIVTKGRVSSLYEMPVRSATSANKGIRLNSWGFGYSA